MTGTRLILDGDDLVQHRFADVEPVVEHAKALRSCGATGSRDMRHAATVPRVVIEQYCQQAGISFHDFMADQAHVRRLLNDPELAGFRIWQGRV